MACPIKRKDIDTKELVRLYDFGLSCITIAHLYRCSPGLVQKRIETIKHPMRVKFRQFNYDVSRADSRKIKHTRPRKRSLSTKLINE